MIDEEIKESLMHLWERARDDEWRRDLTDEEAALVAEWDEQYSAAMGHLVEANHRAEEAADGRAIFV